MPSPFPQSSPFTQYVQASDANGASLTSSLLAQNSGISVVAGSVKLVASAASAVNLYDGSLTALGIGGGLLLTSGMAPETSNTLTWFGQDNTDWNVTDPNTGLPLSFYNGDADIDAVVNTVFQTQSFDATTLSFDFTITDPTATSISFDLVFGSDEYPEWVDMFVDCAVVIVNGVNYALFNHDPNAPLSVVSSNLSAGYFQDNATSTLPIEYDGVSHVLKIVAPIIPGQVNSIKIGIADTGDHIYDSGIFISNMRAGTTPGSGVVITPDTPCTEGADTVTGSAKDELIELKGGDDVAYAGGGDDIVVGGAGKDVIFGGSGNDVLEGDEGDDYLDGGEGTENEAVFHGSKASYSMTYDAASGKYTVTGADGVDVLKSIQLVKFSDGVFDLTPTDWDTPHGTNLPPSDNLPGTIVVSGAAMVGQTLTAIVIDGDGVPPGGVTYDWQSSSDGGTNWTSTGVTTKTYAIASAPAGQQLMVCVSYEDNGGTLESPTSAPLTVVKPNGLAINLVHVSAPNGAGVISPLTTLLNNAIILGFSASEASVAIKKVLGLTLSSADINLMTYDPVAILNVKPTDTTALSVLKVCGQVAMVASASDPTAFNLTLAVMDAAAKGKTINLADPTQLDALLAGVATKVTDIVKAQCLNMADVTSSADTLTNALKEWKDFCGNTDNMNGYGSTFGDFITDLNQSPVGTNTASLPLGTAGTPYTVNAADLLAGFTDPDGDVLSIVDVSANQGGNIASAGAGKWTFTPDAGFVGPVELSFIVSDPSGLTVNGSTMLVIAEAGGTDTTAPTVSTIAYGTNDGTLKAGETVTLTVTLSEVVNVTGTPTIALANGGSASYTGGTGTSTLTFSYTAAAGQDTSDLATKATGALSGTITDAAGNPVLASGFDNVNPSGTLAVDTTAPTVSSIAYGTNDGTLKAGETVTLTVSLSEAVTVTGTPTIALANGGSASYTGGNGTSTLTFSYTAAAGQDTSDLATAATNALGGVIADAAGNAVNAAGFNAVNPTGTLVVDSIAPTVSTFNPTDGSTGVAVASNIVLTFSETIAKGTGTITLRQGSATGTIVETFDVATSARLAFTSNSITIDPTANLANGTSYFVVFVAGTIVDAAGNAYAGVSTYDFTTVPAGNVITGTANADTLTGTAGVDIIYGLAGNDVITGAAGNDIIDGGDGSDIYVVAAAGDHGVAEFNDTGPTGVDEVRFTATAAGTLTLYAGDTGIEKITIGTGTAAAAIATGTTALNVNAAALAYGVAMVGNAGANSLTGGSGNDTLDGGAGADTLAGGVGNDALTGGLAIDTFNVTAGTDSITDLGNGGADVLNVALGATANATVTTAWTASATTVNKGTVNITTAGLAVNLAAVTATTAGNVGYKLTNTGAATTLTGSSLGDSLYGGTGADILVGGAGSDVMDGGDGADIYVVAVAADHGVAEFSDTGLTGIDEVRFTATTAGTLTLYAGDVGLERVVLGTGTAAAAVTTATTANSINASLIGYGITLIGNAGANALTGGTGNDTLTGNAGIDTFNVTAGTDTITDLGNGGADVLNVAAGATANATVTLGWTASATTVNKGIVNITTLGRAVNLAAVTATTAGNLGYHVTNTGAATTLTGSSLGDWLTGGAGADILVGGAGNDVIDGGAGADIYVVAAATDHAVAEFSDTGLTGLDEVRFTATTAGTLTLYAGDTGIERAVLGTGTAAAAVTTATTASSINASQLGYGITLVGNAGANVLTGGSGNDTLDGGAGNDTLVGGAGNDSLTGGAGNDQLRGGAGNDSMTGGAGTDTFIFDFAPNATTNLDTITDFTTASDKILLSAAVFTALGYTTGTQVLTAAQFWSGAGAVAHDADDRIVYNTTTGALYYDADGNGAGAAVQIALIGATAHPTLVATDIQIGP